MTGDINPYPHPFGYVVVMVLLFVMFFLLGWLT